MLTLATKERRRQVGVQPRSPLHLVRLGRIDYLEALEVQQRYAAARGEGALGDTIILAQHPHTLCTGPLGRDAHVLLSERERRAIGLPYYRVDRGGDVMYLGPGQLVAYPVLFLAEHGLDPISYLRALEQVVIGALAWFGVRGRRIPGLTGVWVGEAKIAGVAIKVSRGIATHGFNLNVDPDLSFFRHIVTCGNVGRGVTSMARALGRPVSVSQVEERVIASFEDVLGVEVKK